MPPGGGATDAQTTRRHARRVMFEARRPQRGRSRQSAVPAGPNGGSPLTFLGTWSWCRRARSRRCRFRLAGQRRHRGWHVRRRASWPADVPCSNAVVEDAVVVVSELTTNALMHAGLGSHGRGVVRPRQAPGRGPRRGRCRHSYAPSPTPAAGGDYGSSPLSPTVRMGCDVVRQTGMGRDAVLNGAAHTNACETSVGLWRQPKVSCRQPEETNGRPPGLGQHGASIHGGERVWANHSTCHRRLVRLERAAQSAPIDRRATRREQIAAIRTDSSRRQHPRGTRRD